MSSSVKVQIEPGEEITALAYPAPARSRLPVCLILAHGAGANQTSSFMVEFATALAARGIGTLTFNFAYTEMGRRIPDRNDKLEACYRQVIRSFQDGLFEKHLGKGGLIIGGKSMGGRIASQVAAKDSGFAGLVFLGYPLHHPGRPEQLRASHLPSILAPMLFVQGERDAFGKPEELTPIIRRLKASAEICAVKD